MVGFFFEGFDPREIADQQLRFLLTAMGDATPYTGKRPQEAHRKLPPILAGHFDRRIVLLRETLAETPLSPESRETWIAFEQSFRSAIVES